MRVSIFFLVFLVVSACVQHQKTTSDIALFSDQDKVTISYAEGLDVNYGENYIQLITHSIGNNEFFSDTVFLLTGKGAEIPKTSKILSPKINAIACLSSTHLAYLDILNSVNKVKALCGMSYVQNEKITNQLKENNTIELCLSESLVMENLLKVNPDLFLTYPFGSEGNEKYTSKGIKTIHISEYLETSQLARLEWIKLFGLVLGKSREANNYFDEVEKEYLALKQPEPDTNKKFILNLPYQDNWFMPSANSLTVKIMEDAGFSYYYPSTGATENDNHSKEEVWNDAFFADYWIIIASRPKDFSLVDLMSEEPVYKTFKSVKHQQVIFCNTGVVDYFAQGVIEPHIMLKDLLYAAHKIDNHQPKYFFLLR